MYLTHAERRAYLLTQDATELLDAIEHLSTTPDTSLPGATTTTTKKTELGFITMQDSMPGRETVRIHLAKIDDSKALLVRLEDLPEVHRLTTPHVHVTTTAEGPNPVQLMAGDTPSDLFAMALAYLALGVYLKANPGAQNAN